MLSVLLGIGSMQAKVVISTLSSADFSESELPTTFTVTNGTAGINGDHQLLLSCPANSTNDRNAVFFENGIVNYLKNVPGADSLVWMFNMRQNFTEAVLSGFPASKRGMAVVLAGTKASITDGSGYAVIYGGTSTEPVVRLASYTNGLNANERFTDMITSPTLTKKSSYLSIRVVYVLSTNTWRMYLYDNGTSTGNFKSPQWLNDQKRWGAPAGEVVDATHVDNKTLTYSGFLQNYTGTKSFDCIFDNFTLKTHKTYDKIKLSETSSDNSTKINNGDGQKREAIVTRNLTSVSFNTLCLPFDLTDAQIKSNLGNCVIKELTNAVIEDEVLNLIFSDVTEIEAGKPYLIQPENDITTDWDITPIVVNKNITPVEIAGLVRFTGIFSPTLLPSNDPNTLFLGAGNTLYYTGDGDNELQGMRAYFTLLGSASGAPVRISMRPQTPTDISEIECVMPLCEKVLENGRVVIIRNGERYDVSGRKIQ